MCVSCFASVTAPAAAEAPFPTDTAPLGWPDGRMGGGTLRWTGVAGFRFEQGGASIAFDPFVSRPGALGVLLRRPRLDAPAIGEHFSNLDAVFVGHTHYDHVMDVPEVARVSPRATVHGSLTTIDLLQRLGVDASRLTPVRDGTSVEVGPFRVTAIASAHGRVPFVGRLDRTGLQGAGVPRTPLRYPRGAVFAWRVEAGGRSFHVQGSAGLDERALARQTPVDALVACLAARHSTTRYLERLGAVLRPQVLMPCHHDHLLRPLSAPPRPVPGLDWPAFLDDARALEAAWGTRLHLPPLDRPIGW